MELFLVGLGLFQRSLIVGLLFISEFVLSAESDVGDQSLDLGGFLSALAGGGGEPPPDDVLLDQGALVLLQGEEFSDLVGTFGSQVAGHVDVGQTLDVLVTLLRDRQGQHGNIVSDDTTADGFPAAFASAAGAVAFLVLVQEESHSSLFYFIGAFISDIFGFAEII